MIDLKFNEHTRLQLLLTQGSIYSKDSKVRIKIIISLRRVTVVYWVDTSTLILSKNVQFLISYFNVRIPVQKYSALYIQVASRTLKMIQSNAYVYQDPVETTATCVCLNNLRIIFLMIKSSNIRGINKELSEWAAIIRANVR